MDDRAVISDEQWERVAPLLPTDRGKRGGRYRDHRTVVEAIVWKYRTGSPWRDLPERFGPWQTAWKRHTTWSRDGTWRRMVTALQTAADAAGELEWLVGVDSSIVRAHHHAAGGRPPPARLRGGCAESQAAAGRAA